MREALSVDASDQFCSAWNKSCNNIIKISDILITVAVHSASQWQAPGGQPEARRRGRGQSHTHSAQATGTAHRQRPVRQTDSAAVNRERRYVALS